MAALSRLYIKLTHYHDDVKREALAGLMYCAVNASENSYRLALS